ncbi:hypothetical protein TNIN_452451 [Trichonephila inaurata madagascariensis]|uniref:Uncharacterized protein n=1 Tax=Trichonephila inaurata madagascariensis TaxID=2747483 RepID=A0A8X6IWB2_9ARAC|nr:hypothetical protein TNIN_452451 [Trichonephila inaurata madagascariensis]
MSCKSKNTSGDCCVGSNTSHQRGITARQQSQDIVAASGTMVLKQNVQKRQAERGLYARKPKCVLSLCHFTQDILSILEP